MTVKCHLCNREARGAYNLKLHKKRNHECKFCFEHFAEYIQQTGKPLGHVTDQTIESSHQLTHKRFDRSGYYVKCLASKKHGDQLLNGILYINGYNI